VIRLTKDEREQEINEIKAVLLARFPFLFEWNYYAMERTLFHRASRMPHACWLGVRVQPNYGRITLFLKLFRTAEFDLMRKLYDVVPFEMRGRMREATYYMLIETHIYYKDTSINSVLDDIRKGFEYYTKYFNLLLNPSKVK
jgi:hypothetical protein